MRCLPDVPSVKWAALLLVALLPSGCTVGPNYVAPDAEASGAFANKKDAALSTDAIPVRWWRSFDDPMLTKLVEQSVSSNLDVEIALARIKQARALRTEAVLDGLPIVTSEASYTNNRLSQAEAGEFADNDRRNFEIYDVGFDATWEIDFFGRVRRNVESNTAELSGLIAARRDVIVSLTAEIARNYIELRGFQMRVDIARRNAANQKKTLDLTERLLEGGRGTELDTSRSRAQYFNTLATIPPLDTSIKRAVHRIAVLMGKQPQELYDELLPPKPLPPLPTISKIGNISGMLRRRPDIRVAERNLAARTADIGVATADYFPRVTFNGNVALQANVLTGLGDAGTDAFSFGPVISWAAFDLGRVEARVRQADAQADEALAIYKRTVLVALEETENSLVDYTNQKVRVIRLTDATVASQKAASVANTQFESGLTDFLNVLDAEFAALATEQQLAISQTNAAVALVEIYKSLGGGWEVFPIKHPEEDEKLPENEASTSPTAAGSK